MAKALKAKMRVFAKARATPKQKTKSAAKKRFTIKPSGVIKFAHNNRRHNTGLKRRKHKNRLRLIGHLTSVSAAIIRKSMPYS